MKKSKTFYYTIIKLIKEGEYPLTISKKLGISKQKLNYYILNLKTEGYIKKLSQGAWVVLKEYDGKDWKRVKKINIPHSEHFPSKSKKVRGHGFMFHLKLPKVRNWQNRLGFFGNRGIRYTSIAYGQMIRVFGRKVLLYDKSIVIYDKESYITEQAREARSTAIYEFKKTIMKIESMLNVDFKIRNNYIFKVTKEHYALVKNILAKQYDKEGKKLYVSNAGGQWMIIDNSYNLHELETVKAGEAVDDNEGMQKWFNGMKDTQFKVTPDFILNTMNGIQQNQLIFDSNMKSHLEVLNKIGEAVKELRDEIKKRNI